MHHVIAKAPIKKPQAHVRQDDPQPPQWLNFRGVSRFVGTSPSGLVTVFVDPTLGQPGLQNAQDLLNDADRVVSENDAIFGTATQPVNVIVFALGGATDGTGGADHSGCDFQTGADIEVCASFGNSARVSALFEAELSECHMNNNLCGESTGEALSRWCAAVISNNALSDFATAPTWFQDGMPDFVTNTDQSDTNPDSTGNGMAFISWLLSLGHGLDVIAPTMVTLGDAGTLAELYSSLTGDAAANALPKFMAAIQTIGTVTDDDPFKGGPQVSQLTPATVALAARVFSVILADIAAGKAAERTVASVRAIFGSAPNVKLRGAANGSCSIKSRRLLPPNKV
jgi:hypothetical protein